MVVSPQEAAKRLLELAQASASFADFVRILYPKYKLAPFQATLIDALDKLEKGTLLSPQTGLPVHRLMINMPPRHGKTFYATQLFPVYFMARKPTRKVMSASYNAELATTFGRNVRETAKEPTVLQAFPKFQMASDSKAADHWSTTLGGSYYGVGIGGTTTGRAANLLIVDDPIKARAEAESMTYRNNIYSYYISALITRKEPDVDGEPPIEIIINTRWHPDDLTARIMQTEEWKSGEWYHINFPAISEQETDERIYLYELPVSDPRHKSQDETLELPIPERYVYKTVEVPLWPERFSLDMLNKYRVKDQREFASLYQQSPYIVGGNLIKQHWWRTIPEETPQYTSIIMAADTAFKKNERSDYSVILVAGTTKDGYIDIIEVIRGKYEFPELKRLLNAAAFRFRTLGLRGVYIEDKASGQSLIQELKRETTLPILSYRSMDDKVARATAVLPLIEAGRVRLPAEAHWLPDFKLEATQFPNSPHDDQVDAMVIAVDTLSRMTSYANEAFNIPLELSGSLYNMVEQARLRMPSIGNSRAFLNWGE